MAKLSTRGRFEIARIAFENTSNDKQFTYQRYWTVYGKAKQDWSPMQFKDFMRARYKRGNNPDWREIITPA